MSYCIEYNPEMKRKYPRKNIFEFKRYKIILILLLCFAGSYILVQSGLVRYVLPGDPEVTTSALENMLNGLIDGVSVEDAVHSFCEEIIVGSGK